jgi:transposase
VRADQEAVAELNDIDAKAGDDLDHKAELRSAESASIPGKMKWLLSQVPLKALSIGKAAYTLANGDGLTRERAIRGPVVGRKNHFGSKSRRGTEVAAICTR